jgi:hypothetical protein
MPAAHGTWRLPQKPASSASLTWEDVVPVACTLGRLGAGIGGAVLALLMSLAVPSPAAAAGGGLRLDLRGADPTKPSMVLTNGGATACSVVAGPLGTLALTKVEQNGQVITPTGAQANADEGFGYVLQQQVKALAPGQSIEVPLSVLEWGPTGFMLQTVTWSPSAGGYAWFYPVVEGKPLSLVGTYSMPPIDLGGNPPACEPATDGPAIGTLVAPPKSGGGAGRWPDWVWISGGALIVALALMVVVIGARGPRTRPATAGGAGAIATSPGRRTAIRPRTRFGGRAAATGTAAAVGAAAVGAAAAGKAASDKAATEKAATDKAATDQAGSGKAATGTAPTGTAATDKAAAEAAGAGTSAGDKAWAERVAKDKLARDKLARDKLAKDKLARDKLARDKLAKDKPAADTLAPDKPVTGPAVTGPAAAGGVAGAATAARTDPTAAPARSPSPAPLSKRDQRKAAKRAARNAEVTRPGPTTAGVAAADPAPQRIPTRTKSRNVPGQPPAFPPPPITTKAPTGPADRAAAKGTAGTAGKEPAAGKEPPAGESSRNAPSSSSAPADDDRSGGIPGVIALIVFAAGIVAAIAPAQRADATVVPSKSVQAAWKACGDLLHLPGHDPANILGVIDDPTVQVDLAPGNPAAGNNGTAEYGLSPKHSLITWNTTDTHPYIGSGGNADPCDSLYHELYHVFQHVNGAYSDLQCVTQADGATGISVAEVEATRAQNRLRVALGRPARTHYGDRPMPTGNCLPPADPLTCHDPARDTRIRQAPARPGTVIRPEDLIAGTRDGCGETNGDPHLRTLDGRRYDFQAVGEFVLARDRAAGFEVQVRQQPITGSRIAAVTSTVSMAVGSTRQGDRVEVQLDATGSLRLVIGGANMPLSNKFLASGGYVQAADKPGTVSVFWPDGSVVEVFAIGGLGLRVSVEPSAGHDGKLDGLLGNLNNDPADDLKTPDGKVIADASFATLYPDFANSWRVDKASSLFTYADGTDPTTYADPTFPDNAVAVDQLPGREAAETACRQYGVTDPAVLANCIYDVALTGQPDFALAAAAGQDYAAGVALTGTEWTLNIAAANGTATAQFDASAGQRAFIDVLASSLPNQCGVLSVAGPTGDVLGSGCIADGRGYVDGLTLPFTGKYTITLDPQGTAVGQARIRLYVGKDQTGTLTVDGPATPVKLDLPGTVFRLTFTGSAGQKVFLDATNSSLPDQCGALVLRGPDDQAVAAGCLLQGSGFIDGTVLPATGTYTVVVDPGDRAVGSLDLAIITITDQRSSIAVNGPDVPVTIGKPGAAAYLTFTGAAGQQLTVEVRGATFPDQCGAVVVRDAEGTALSTGCLTGGSGTLAAFAVPRTGTYTVVIDPADRQTGSATVRLHS